MSLRLIESPEAQADPRMPPSFVRAIIRRALRSPHCTSDAVMIVADAVDEIADQMDFATSETIGGTRCLAGALRVIAPVYA